MSINKADIDFAFYVLDQAIYTHKPLSIQDCALIKKFIEALLEHKQQPSDNVKSREWRAAVYRKLLDDPAALQQFTEQAIQKFGPERLSHMVAPQLQEIIVNEAFSQMSTGALVNALKEHNRWTEVLEYAFATEEEWVLDHFGLRDQINAAYDSGLAEGQEQANESQIQEAYNEGFEDGRKASG